MRDPVYTEYLKARYADPEMAAASAATGPDREAEMARAKRLVEEALRATQPPED
jgi:hypothetical protein